MDIRTRQERAYVLGPGLQFTVLTRGSETDGRHDLVDGFKAPGATTPLHLHTRYEERLWVLEGELTVWCGEEKNVLGPGGFYAIPMNAPHALAAGREGARNLTVSSPAGFSELVERAGIPAHLAGADTEMDLELLAEISADLGDVILGPPGTLPGSAADTRPEGRRTRRGTDG